MTIKEPQAPAVGDKGLQAGALGLVGNIVIGLAAVAPAYSLAATLGAVVLNVQEKAPAMFVPAFIPMLLVAFAYKEAVPGHPRLRHHVHVGHQGVRAVDRVDRRLMLACFAFGTKRFFRGKTLNAQTEVKVPDTY